jgi:hypothetical protein
MPGERIATSTQVASSGGRMVVCPAGGIRGWTGPLRAPANVAIRTTCRYTTVKTSLSTGRPVAYA